MYKYLYSYDHCTMYLLCSNTTTSSCPQITLFDHHPKGVVSVYLHHSVSKIVQEVQLLLSLLSLSLWLSLQLLLLQL